VCETNRARALEQMQDLVHTLAAGTRQSPQLGLRERRPDASRGRLDSARISVCVMALSARYRDHELTQLQRTDLFQTQHADAVAPLQPQRLYATSKSPAAPMRGRCRFARSRR
jgi:hypothetical protein